MTSQQYEIYYINNKSDSNLIDFKKTENKSQHQQNETKTTNRFETICSKLLKS